MSIKKQLKTEYQAKEASMDVDFDSILQQADYPQIEKPEKRPIRFKPVFIAFGSVAATFIVASAVIIISLGHGSPTSSGGDQTRQFDIGTYGLDFVSEIDNGFYQADANAHLVISAQSDEKAYGIGSVPIGEKFVMTFHSFTLSKLTFASPDIANVGYVVSATSDAGSWTFNIAGKKTAKSYNVTIAAISGIQQPGLITPAIMFKKMNH